MGKINIGILGVAGHFMTRLALPMSQSDSVAMVAIASRNLKKAEAAAEKWDIGKAYGSYEELLADDSVEAVYIPLPNNLHLEWIMKAMEAGKHVLCEKPLTMNEEETAKLIGFADKMDVKVMEAFMYRFHPKWQMVRELMSVSGIGEINAVHTMFGFSNADPGNIRNQKALGGGALMDIGCYAVESARWIIGRNPMKVMGLNHYSEAFGTDILSSAILDFGRARALFTVSTSTYPVQEVKIYGTGGTVEVVIPFNDTYDVPAKVKVTTGLGERTVEFPPANQYGAMLDAFARAIRHDEAMPVSLESSLVNMRILDKLVLSGNTGEWQEV